MNPLRFTRRNLLRGGLAATAAYPLLEADKVKGQTASPTRLIVVTTPNGTRNALYWPDASLNLPMITAPLEPYKQKLNFLKGVRLNDQLQNGSLGGMLGSEHARGTGGMLTGRPLNAGTEFVSFGNTTSGWGSGESIDQYLVDRLAPPTTFTSFQMGVHVRDTQVRARIAYRGDSEPIPPREDPNDVFSALFSGATTGTPGSSDPASQAALTRLWAQRQSVFDLTNAETNRLMGIVGAADQQKLQAFQDSMRDVETRLVQMPSMDGSTTGGPTPNTTCMAPSFVDPDLTVDNLYAQAGQIQMDLAAAALQCDQTRILTFQWSYSESEHLFQFLNNIQGNHHAISHDFSSSGVNYDAYNAIQTWYASQFAYFLGKLDAIDEGDGTLLDHSLVLWATEIGESTQHDLTMMPYILAGSAGGKLQTGRLIDFSDNRQDNNQMLVSIANIMGAEDLTSFGDPSGKTGPLPELM
ncbi:MAG TPA: DUF1552 domain-containing protein [Polyangiaceae bacterium]|nr:DUF1552 domain-containing protein [Polyangiaceae bacterium]